MKIDCEWFSSHLEAYCCDNLSETELQMAREHLGHCSHCRHELEALENIDSMVQQVFEHRLSTARATSRQSPGRMARPAFALAGILLVLFLGLKMSQSPVDQPAPVVVVQPPVVEETVTTIPEEKKSSEEQPIQRAKPDDELRMADLRPRPELDVAKPEGPEFAVIDAAGYSTTLDNYKGYILLFGVWSETQPETTDALNRIYSALGNDPQVRILGIASQRQDRLDRAAFPVAFNRGSHLFGMKTGEFMLLDQAGHRRLSGSLLDNPGTVISRIKSQVDQLHAR